MPIESKAVAVPERRFRLQLPQGLSCAELDVVAPATLWLPRELMNRGLSSYEPDTLACFLACLDTTKTGEVFDIGANTGVFSWLAAAAGRKVVAFEPTPELVACGNRIAHDNKLAIRTEQIAIGDKDGTATFYLSAQSDVSSSLAKGYRPEAGTLTVPVETLVSYCARTETAPTVLKIDTETTEDAVLEGGRAYLERARPWIICEVLTGQEAVLAGKLEPLNYAWYQITNEKKLVRRREIFGDRGHDFRNWLFAPDEPDAAFWDSFVRWQKALAPCRPHHARTLLDAAGLSFHRLEPTLPWRNRPAWQHDGVVEILRRGNALSLRTALEGTANVKVFRGTSMTKPPSPSDATECLPGVRYELSCDVEGHNPGMPGVFMYVLQFDRAKQVHSERVWLRPGANSVSFIGHADAVSMRVMFRLTGTGELVIHPLRLYRLDDA